MTTKYAKLSLKMIECGFAETHSAKDGKELDTPTTSSAGHMWVSLKKRDCLRFKLLRFLSHKPWRCNKSRGDSWRSALI